MGIEIAVIHTTLPTGGTTVDFTSSGFGTPLAAEFITCEGVTDDTVADHNVLGYGVTDGTRQWALGIQSEDASGVADCDRLSHTSFCLRTYVAGTRTEDGELSFNSFITDGVRCNVDTAFNSAYGVTVILYKGDDVNVYVDSFLVNVVTDTNVSVTAPGFTPDIVKMMNINHSSQDVNSAEMMISRGFAVNDGSETQRCLSWQERNGVGDSRCASVLHTDRIAHGWLTTGATDYELELTSFDANGFTVTTRSGSATAYQFYFAIECPSNDVAVVTHATPTATGNQSNTSLSFTPQYVEFMLSRLTATNSVDTDDDATVFGTGVFTATDESSMCVSHDDGAGTTDTQSMTDSTAANQIDHVGSDENKASFVSMNSDGWTLNFSAAGSSAKQWGALAIEEEAAAPTGDIFTLAMMGIGR